MGSQAIDLSAGMVPKQQGTVNLSAGMVPKGQTGVTAPPTAQHAWDWSHPLDSAVEVGKGVAKSVLNSLGGINDLTGGSMLAPIGTSDQIQQRARDVSADLHTLGTPNNTPQRIGKVAGDIGQFFIPGAGEEAAAGKLAAIAPKLAPLARIGVKAAGAGLVNKVEGGSALAGAAAGGIGEGAAQGLKAIAPALAETALGVRATDRAYGRTPGQAILSETTGIRPSSIAQQAGTKVDQYGQQLDAAAQQSAAPVNLQPARDTAQNFQQTALLQNNHDTIKDIGKIAQQLTDRQGEAIPQHVSAFEGLGLKRGLNALTEYNPTAKSDLVDAGVKSTVQSLHPELAAAIPGYDTLNAQMSTLMPVAKRATAADLNAGVLQRIVGRVARPTGALVGAGAGGYEGYQHGGLPGAVAGTAAGLVLPELLASPTTLMGEARLAASPTSQSLARIGPRILPPIYRDSAQER